MTVIKYEQDKHFDTIKSWADERGVEMHSFFLSKIGFIVVDDNEQLQMAIWVYHILEVPIIQIDNLISRPGMNIFEARKCWKVLIDIVREYIDIIEKSQNIKFILKATFNKRMSKEIERTGFILDDNDVIIARSVIPVINI